jgi:hypothetical protein
MAGDVREEIKIKLSLCLIKFHVMKTYGEWRYSFMH